MRVAQMPRSGQTPEKHFGDSPPQQFPVTIEVQPQFVSTNFNFYDHITTLYF